MPFLENRCFVTKPSGQVVCPSLGRFAQADAIVPGGAQGYDRYAYVNNDPVRYADPSGHMTWNGEGGNYDDERRAHDAYVQQRDESLKCGTGGEAYCSTVDLIIKHHPKPVSGIHIGYSGQAGFGFEGGVYDQWDFLVDWKEGNLYIVQTVGYFGYRGTPTGLEGDVYIGTSNVNGIPGDVENITNYLEGSQFDVSGSINVDAGLFAGGNKGLSVALDESGNPVYSPGAGYMYTTKSSLVFGGNAVPNAVDINVQWGASESFVMKVIPLPWNR